MEQIATSLTYDGLILAYDEGNLTTGDFIHVLAEHGWLNRYVEEFIGMVN